jgi:hypothetical protein
MEQWLDEMERGTVVSARVTASEKKAIERLRKMLRMKSKGEVIRFGLHLVEGVASLADVDVLTEDEQVKVLRQFADMVQGSDDEYLKSEQAADDLEEAFGGMLGRPVGFARMARPEDEADRESNLFEGSEESSA